MENSTPIEGHTPDEIKVLEVFNIVAMQLKGMDFVITATTNDSDYTIGRINCMDDESLINSLVSTLNAIAKSGAHGMWLLQQAAAKFTEFRLGVPTGVRDDPDRALPKAIDMINRDGNMSRFEVEAEGDDD